jgi:hypothetical protein
MGFKPGETGNPGGRPRKTEAQRQFEAKAQEWCRLFAFDKLRDAAMGGNPKRADWALEMLLDRAFGKAMAVQQIDAEITPASGSSVEDIGREVADLIGGGEAKGSGVDSAGTVDPGQ